MLIIGIDPGISGSICFLENGKIVVVQGYFDESIEKMEIAAYTEAQNQNQE